MKKVCFWVALQLLAIFLSAQTQTLPDLRISGESGIKAHLYKRSLLFSPMFDISDSLPVFIPNGLPNQEGKLQKKQLQHRSYLQLEGNSEVGANSFLSLYPKVQAINGITHHLQLSIPDENRTSFRNDLFLGIQPAEELPLAFKLSFHSAKTTHFNTGNLDISLAHYRKMLQIGKTSINDLGLQFGFNRLAQENQSFDFDRSYLDYYLATRLQSGWLDTKLKLIGQAGEAAIQVAPSLKWNPEGIDNLRFHVLADAYNFVPSLEFHYRDPLTGGAVFTLANLPEVEGNSFSSLLGTNPWQAFSDGHKLQKTPLNLLSSLEFVFPRSRNFSLSRLNFSNLLKYDINAPLPRSGINPGVAELKFTDTFSNVAEAEGLFRMESFILRQRISVDLAYLPRESMYRAPYRPILKVDSRFSYPYRNWLFSTAILQNYFSKDHLNNNLPEAVIVNLAAEYHRENSAIYALIENFLNQKQWIFSELPATGITAFVGMKHRF